MKDIQFLLNDALIGETVNVSGIHSTGLPFSITGKLSYNGKYLIGIDQSCKGLNEFAELDNKFSLSLTLATSIESGCNFIVDKITDTNGNTLFQNDKNYIKTLKNNLKLISKEQGLNIDTLSKSNKETLQNMLGKMVITKNKNAPSCVNLIVNIATKEDSNSELLLLDARNFVTEFNNITSAKTIPQTKSEKPVELINTDTPPQKGPSFD